MKNQEYRNLKRNDPGYYTEEFLFCTWNTETDMPESYGEWLNHAEADNRNHVLFANMEPQRWIPVIPLHHD